MKTITKLLLMGAIIIGMVACSNDDVPQTPESLKGSTYATVAVTLPKAPSTRAGLPGDYNYKEEWKGIDAIETVTVFLVNETSGSESIDFESFKKVDFEGVDANGILAPKLALKATPGDNVKAYVVLNGNNDILTALKAATTPAKFLSAYEAAVAEIASNLAKNNGTNDVIMMTNTELPTAISIQPNITEGEAMTGSANTFFVNVERVVSRAIATVKADTHTIPVLNYLGEAGSGSTITITDLKYVVGQSNKEFFLTKKTDWTTPAAVYNHVPGEGTTVWDPTLFDNTGLAVAERSTVLDATGGTALTQFEAALTGELADSKFVLPVTHKDANYRKGNTTYFEVIAIFTPNAVIDDGIATYTDGDDVFLGMKDGLFYSTRALAEASGQKATGYKGDGTTGAIMKYVLWLNPNVIPGTAGKKASMSPTVRNQVYHAHIKGFKSIGVPNNPINPDDPNDPLNPKNPIDPSDPLETNDTYLSVEITVLPWGIHSYEIDLGNDY